MVNVTSAGPHSIWSVVQYFCSSLDRMQCSPGNATNLLVLWCIRIAFKAREYLRSEAKQCVYDWSFLGIVNLIWWLSYESFACTWMFDCGNPTRFQSFPPANVQVAFKNNRTVGRPQIFNYIVRVGEIWTFLHSFQMIASCQWNISKRWSRHNSSPIEILPRFLV